MDGPAAAGDEAQRARLKALLSSYYGGGSDASNPGAGDASGGSSGRPGTNPTQRGHPDHNTGPPPPGMDSPAFNADKHIAQVGEISVQGKKGLQECTRFRLSLADSVNKAFCAQT